MQLPYNSPVGHVVIWLISQFVFFPINGPGRTSGKPRYYIMIIMMASFMRVSYKHVFDQSKCINAIKGILSTIATYISSSSFMFV